MAQEGHWLPGLNFNVEEWDAEGLDYETLAICRSFKLARAVLAAAVAEKPALPVHGPQQDAGGADPGKELDRFFRSAEFYGSISPARAESNRLLLLPAILRRALANENSMPVGERLPIALHEGFFAFIERQICNFTVGARIAALIPLPAS